MVFESIDVWLDEVGCFGLPAPPNFFPHCSTTLQAQGSSAEKQVESLLRRVQGDDAVPASSNGNRPQDSFAAPFVPDNSRRPFVPRLLVKHNATHGLPTLQVIGDGKAPPLHLHRSAPHPYGPELAELQYPDWVFERVTEQPFVSPFTTPFAYVDNEEAFKDMMAHLESGDVQEVAIDLEHHSMHSHQGFTCLVQLSTRAKNFVVDAQALRSQLHELNRVTSDPSVLKVMHGCRQDVLWLQRDFGVYLVGVLDTGAAAKELDFPSLGLAFLLRTYAGVEAAKQHQLADWRVRSLPDELIAYARDDTHYLLGIADRLRNELLSAPTDSGSPGLSRMQCVLDASRALCAQHYEKEPINEATVKALRSKIVRGPLSAANMRVFTALAEWRDRVARLADESSHVIMPRRVLAKLAQSPPVSVPDLLQKCRPVTPSIRAHAKLVVDICQQSVAGAYEVPFLNPAVSATQAQDAALFDGTWATWAAQVKLQPRQDLDKAVRKALKKGGMTVLARPGRALQPQAGAAGSAQEELMDTVDVQLPAHLGGAHVRLEADGGSDDDVDIGESDAEEAGHSVLQLPAVLGVTGVAPEPAIGFLNGSLVGLLGDVVVSTPSTVGSGADSPAAVAGSPLGALAAAEPMWAEAIKALAVQSTAPSGGAGALGSGQPHVVRVRGLAGKTAASRKAAAQRVLATLQGTYLAHSVPGAAPDTTAMAAAAAASMSTAPVSASAAAGAADSQSTIVDDGAEEDDVMQLPKSLNEVYDMSLKSRKRQKTQGKSNVGDVGAPAAPPAAPGAGAGAAAAAERSDMIKALEAEAKTAGDDRSFMAALGWDAGLIAAEQQAPAAATVAASSHKATRSLLTSGAHKSSKKGSGAAMTAASMTQQGQSSLRKSGGGAGHHSIAAVARGGSGRAGRSKGGSSKSKAGGKGRKPNNSAMGALLG